jgi:WD40 repeat protein
MFWTTPNDNNNFTVSGKCRIGHKQDVLSINSNSQYIVTGGCDGLVSVWNIFSGFLKYAIAMPNPTEKHTPAADEDEETKKGRITLKRSIVGLLFHPDYKTIVLVL